MAKKNKKKSRPPNARDPQEVRRERLEARRAAKAEAVAARQRAERRARMVRIALLAALGTAIFWFIFLRNQAPSEIGGHRVQEFSSTGVNEHVAGTISYEQAPPVSGAHAGQAGPCGVFSQQIPNETQVHNLEHGAVGIQYEPDLPTEDIRAIEEIAAGEERNVFSAPYQGLDEGRIAVTSWGRAMYLDELDVAAINEYIDVFAGEGPEPGQECPNASNNPFEPDVTVTPGAGASPEGEAPEEESSPAGGSGTEDEESPAS